MDLALRSLLFSAIFLLFSLPVGWVTGVLARKILVSSERKLWTRSSVIYAEYDSPDLLRPGEVAYLYDRVFGQPELLATLFDLELRDKVELSPLPKTITGVNFSIRVLGKPTDSALLDFEQEVLVTIKSYGASATWEQLKADTAIWDSTIERHLAEDLQEKGYLEQETSGLNAGIKYSLIGVAIAGLTVLLPLLLDAGIGSAPAGVEDGYAALNKDITVFVGLLLWLLASAIYGFAAYAAASTYYHALDIEKGTAQLKKMWPHLAGFREYLQVVEQDRIKFENEELRSLARQHSLPYAVALDLSTRWQSRFSEVSKTAA